MKILSILILGLLLRLPVQAQEINWISFSALSDSLKVQPKPVFIFFHTDWCAYCRKMEKETFKNPDVVNLLNTAYYAVSFNAESKEEINFDGQWLRNPQPQARNSIHEMAQLLAGRKGGISFPTTLILTPDFTVRQRNFNYLSSKKLLEMLRK